MATRAARGIEKEGDMVQEVSGEAEFRTLTEQKGKLVVVSARSSYSYVTFLRIFDFPMTLQVYTIILLIDYSCRAYRYPDIGKAKATVPWFLCRVGSRGDGHNVPLLDISLCMPPYMGCLR